MLAAILYALPVAAEETAPESSDKIGDQGPGESVSVPDGQIITLVIENDSIGGRGTDENYTSGVSLSYLDVSAEMPEIAYTIADYIPTFDINDSSSVVYSFGQNLYTPRDIQQSTQDPNDRPWAAHLYAAIGLVTITDDHVDEVEVSLGVVGPWALGKQTQTF